MSLFINITLTVASQPKARTVTTIDGDKQVLDVFGLVLTGRAKQPDGSYKDTTMPVELSIWNGLGASLIRDHDLTTGDRLALQARIKGHRAYSNKDGEIKSILSLEADQSGGYPVIQKARAKDDAVAF